MATDTIPLSSPIGANIFEDSNSNGTGTQVKASSAVVFGVDIDNSLNTSTSHTKLYNNAAPTIGTTAPHAIIRTKASARRMITYGTGEGATFGTALFVATVTAGGTGGTTSPGNAVTVRVLYT